MEIGEGNKHILTFPRIYNENEEMENCPEQLGMTLKSLRNNRDF
jgi:hypothetical protein